MKKCHFIFLFFLLGLRTLAQESLENNGACVFEDDFFKKTFYTWTTVEQISELREKPTLLTKSKSETKGYSLFDISLRDSSLADNPYAQLLQEEQFAKKRFAWTNAWATIMGWKGETYGNQLVKIVLNDSSIIGMFKVHSYYEDDHTVLSFYNLHGDTSTQDYVFQNKHRIAAIYHSNYSMGDRNIWQSKGTYSRKGKNIQVTSKIPFREFVIINEKMIQSWEYGTSSILQELQDEIALLEEFKKSKTANQKYYQEYIDGWELTSKNDKAEWMRLYQNMKCFENNYYLYNNKRLSSIIKALEIASESQTSEIKH